MDQVGIRELRQRASELLRHVELGQTYQITDRGRPVALLTPLPIGQDGLARLRAAGLVRGATLTLDDLPDPVDPEAGEPLISDVLADLRDDER